MDMFDVFSEIRMGQFARHEILASLDLDFLKGNITDQEVLNDMTTSANGGFHCRERFAILGHPLSLLALFPSMSMVYVFSQRASSR